MIVFSQVIKAGIGHFGTTAQSFAASGGRKIKLSG